MVIKEMFETSRFRLNFELAGRNIHVQIYFKYTMTIWFQQNNQVGVVVWEFITFSSDEVQIRIDKIFDIRKRIFDWLISNGVYENIRKSELYVYCVSTT